MKGDTIDRELERVDRTQRPVGEKSAAVLRWVSGVGPLLFIILATVHPLLAAGVVMLILLVAVEVYFFFWRRRLEQRHTRKEGK